MVAAWQRTLGLGAAGPALLRNDLRVWARRTLRADPDVMLFAARVSVWGRWFVLLIGAFEVAYRPSLWYPADIEYLCLGPPLLVFNGLVHHRLNTNRTVTWRWLLLLSAVDVALITGAVIIGAEFHLFVYVAYYPALALFAVVFTSLGLCLAWTTVVAAIYAIFSVSVSGLDFDAGQEKALLARVAAMYAVVAGVSLIARFERARRRESAQRERELHRQRIELSQAIHDTAAQTAYMVSMGVQRAMRLAGDSNEELASTLAGPAGLAHPPCRRPIRQFLFRGWVLPDRSRAFIVIRAASFAGQRCDGSSTHVVEISHAAIPTIGTDNGQEDSVGPLIVIRPVLERKAIDVDGFGVANCV